MIVSLSKSSRSGLILLLIYFSAPALHAQELMLKKLSVHATALRLEDALTAIGNNGGFYFSYNSRLLNKDSLVTVAADQQPLYAILEGLFHGRYEFEEQRNYIIISAALPHLAMVNTDITNEGQVYSISGFVVDEGSGERLVNVSVYEKRSLAGTLSDAHGYFKLKFKAADDGVISLSASRLFYKEASLNFLRSVPVSNRTQFWKHDRNREKEERDVLGKFFISLRQRIQLLNIPDFFASRPFQFSLTPGLSTHGLMSSQVVNHFSLNVAGGYTAGVNGFEAGGLFNINRKDSKYLQLAGVFNLVGGHFTGLQLAGVNNRALDTVNGVQLAGFINKAEKQVSGVQIAALNNEAHILKGLQIGLVNIADTSHGASIGLINIIRNGFYRVGYSANTLMNTNLSLSMGNHLFYNTVLLGSNISNAKRMYAVGLGAGHDVLFSDRVYLSLAVSYLFAYKGESFDDRWLQGKLLLNVQATKRISLMAGPTFNNYSQNDGYGYQGVIKPRWVGWEAGLAFNSAFRPVRKVRDDSEAWYLGLAGSTALNFNQLYNYSYGTELFVQRDLGGKMAGTLSAGIQRSVDKGDPALYASWQSPMGIASRKTFSAIPVKAGMRAYLNSGLYFSGEIGLLFGLNHPYRVFARPFEYVNYDALQDKNMIITAASSGYSFKNGLETGVFFESNFSPSFLRAGIRAAYRFKL